ncbi:MAG: 3-phosphoshikimate 1-carboxyvinyltransferase [Gemmatimonadetes bacterium]|nr:3-phosphoshikimate 1-carboxyvinyltransferase [Gemmatimonadota bacterium]
MNVRVPGDKSLSQRALILASLADGRSRLQGLLYGGDTASTADALRALGVSIPPIPEQGGVIEVDGVGLRGLRSPHGSLDMGNSGTGTRLLMGVLAGSPVSATLTGDASLRRRPMRRVTEPLAAMGASFAFTDAEGMLPLTVIGADPLRSIDWPSPVASAQVKSAILLAGLTGGAFSLITEPRQSRDHTERLFRQVGVAVLEHPAERGWRVEMRDPPGRIDPLDFSVPGDISSAAFVLALCALGGTRAPVTVSDVGLNPTRTAFLDVLARMGASLDIEVDPGLGQEPTGSVSCAQEALCGTDVSGEEIPRLIDELPLVAVLGARAAGTTRIRGAAELRAKESDRIDALVRNLRTLGVEVEEFDDGLEVVGSDRPLEGRIKTFGDHRIAMAFGVLGALPGNRVVVDEPGAAAVSFPGFWELLKTLSGEP